jgi:hypothetical protein
VSASSSSDETLRCELVVAVCYTGDVAVNCLEDCVRLSMASAIRVRWVVNCYPLCIVFSVFVQPACSICVNSLCIICISLVFSYILVIIARHFVFAFLFVIFMLSSSSRSCLVRALVFFILGLVCITAFGATGRTHNLPLGHSGHRVFIRPVSECFDAKWRTRRLERAFAAAYRIFVY